MYNLYLHLVHCNFFQNLPNDKPLHESEKDRFVTSYSAYQSVYI